MFSPVCKVSTSQKCLFCWKALVTCFVLEMALKDWAVSRVACCVLIKLDRGNCWVFLEEFPRNTLNWDNLLQAQREHCRNAW